MAENFGLALGRPLKLINSKMKNPWKLEFPLWLFFVMLLGRKWAPNPHSMKVQSMMVISKKKFMALTPTVRILWPSEIFGSKKIKIRIASSRKLWSSQICSTFLGGHKNRSLGTRDLISFLKWQPWTILSYSIVFVPNVQNVSNEDEIIWKMTSWKTT